MFTKLQGHFHYTTATILAIIGAAITLATTFGLHVSATTRDGILQLVGLVLGGIVVGGGVKSAGMLNAGIHPLQRAAADASMDRMRDRIDRAALTFDPPPTRANANTAVSYGVTDTPPPDGPGPEIPHLRTPRHRPYSGDARDVHPILRAHGSFHGMPLGKLEARIDPRTPVLAEFMTAGATLGRKLPKATHRFDELIPEVGGDFGMMGNDSYGDCTCAALGHALQFWTGVGGGTPVTLTAAQILALYWATGTADDGRVMFEVLKYAHHNGLAGHDLGAYVAVGLRRYHHRDVRASIDLFGGCYLGVGLPETAQSQSVWDAVGDPTKPGPAQFGSWGGHAIWLADYDHDGVDLVTWGHKQRATWRFVDAYADEGYCVIAPDWLRGGKTVEGVDLAGLNAYLEKIKSGYQPPA